MIEPQEDMQRRKAHRFEHGAMACTFGVYICGDDATYAEQAAAAAFEEVDRLEQELSRFVEHSDIARINAARTGEAVLIGMDALECLELAARVRAETNAAFDVTLGAGADFVELDRAQRTVTKRAANVTVDLGAVGKGYAVDAVVAVLDEWSIEAALIHAGQSTVFAMGTPWPLAIRDPECHQEILGYIELCDRAAAGSGRLVHGDHIIDPRSGVPATGMSGAWATAPTAAMADALSTAFMVMTPEEVAEFHRRRTDISGTLALRTKEGRRVLSFGVDPIELADETDSEPRAEGRG